METATTRWGDRITSIYTFRVEPFGDVMLNNFHKVGPEMFAIWLSVPNKSATYNMMNVTWWNCHADDAHELFGIERSEQNMWGD